MRRLLSGWFTRDEVAPGRGTVRGGARALAVWAVVAAMLFAPGRLGAVLPSPNISNPSDMAVTTGHVAQFFAFATGTPTPTYQWQRKPAGDDTWSNLTESSTYSGTTTTTLSVDDTIYAMSGDQFRCVATNSNGSTASAAATLTVSGAPGFVDHPRTTTVAVGQSISFAVTTSSADAVTYQWRHNREDLAGATTAAYAKASVTLADAGLYEVVATNSSGSTRSYFYVNVIPPKLAAVAWGLNDDTQTDIPGGMGALEAVACGWTHTLALKADGTVSAWGQDFSGQTAVPAGLEDVVAIAAGGEVSLALKADGTVVGWGDASSGGTGPGATPPAGLSDVIAISAGQGSGAALRASGKVVTWGWLPPYGAPHDAGYVALALGAFHALALKADGTVTAWGEDTQGETDVPEGLTDVVAIAAGGSAGGGHSLALRADGTVVAWGYNYFGQCDVPEGLTDVVAIAAGGNFSMALKADGTLVAWGQGDAGQIDIPATAMPAVAVAAGFAHAVALTEAEAPTITSSPASRTINVGSTTTLTVTASGTGPFAYQWLRNGAVITDGGAFSGTTSATLTIANAQASDTGNYVVRVSNAAGTASSTPASVKVVSPPPLTLRPANAIVVAGQPASFTVAAAGSGPFTYVWKHNRQAIDGATGATLQLAAATAADAGYYEVSVTSAVGGVARSLFYVSVAVPRPVIKVWGNYAPVTPVISGPIAAIDQGGLASVALLADGTVREWSNDSTLTDVPAGLSGVVAVSCGDRGQTLALKQDGTVVGWGGSEYGDTTPPAGLTGVVAIAAGFEVGLALKSDGTVVAWGNDYFGTTNVPEGLKDVVAITTGGLVALALKSDGTVVGWGDGWNPNDPALEGLSDVVQISAGSGHALALRGDGTVVAWGQDYAGSTEVPDGLADVTAIVAGEAVSFALKSDGTAVAWGRDYENQATVPEGLQHVAAIAGYASGMALVSVPPSPFITSQPEGQTVAAGASASIEAAASGDPFPLLQWQVNGITIDGATSPTLELAEVQPADAGLYWMIATNDSTTDVTDPAIVGVGTSGKVIGTGTELQPANIRHPNGNIFDQVLLTGVAETITADAGQVTRTSFIDLNDDIVQVEFSGHGSLSLVLDDASGPATPVNYNQPTVNYMKGHAGIVIVGADETTNVSVFSVGRATAFDPTGTYDLTKPISVTNDPTTNGSPLFVGHGDTQYDGIADIAFIAILSTDGKFGGVRTANANYFASHGLTGVYAPGVEFVGPVFIGNIEAFDDAVPAIRVGAVSDARITGGDLLQDNGAAVRVSGLTQLKFTAGGDSAGNSLPAKANQAVLEQDGVDVTAQIVVEP